MTSNNPAPLACKLPVADFKHRSKWLKELTLKALVSYQIKGYTAYMAYREGLQQKWNSLSTKNSSAAAFCGSTLSGLRPG